MWLVLANALDPAGPWLAAGLATRTFHPVLRVTEIDLGHAQIWEHVVGGNGSWFRLQLADGRWIDSREISGVINRLHQSPFAQTAVSHGSEHAYAVQEIAALLIGCLAGAGCPTLNSPGAPGVASGHRDPSEWLILAGAAGLTVRSPLFYSHYQSAIFGDDEPWKQNRLLIIAENVLHLGPADSVPKEVRAAAVRLAAIAQTPLLELHFLQDEFGNWIFQRAQPCADLLAAGDAALDAIASLVLASVDSRTHCERGYFSSTPFLPEPVMLA